MGEGRGGFQGKASFKPGTSRAAGSHVGISGEEGCAQREGTCKSPEAGAGPRL